MPVCSPPVVGRGELAGREHGALGVADHGLAASSRCRWVPTTVPPSDSARVAVASRSATVSTTNQPGASSPAGTSEPMTSAKPSGAAGLAGADAGVDRGLEVVAVAGDADRRGPPLVGEPPAEQVAVEALGVTEVGGAQVAEVPGAGGVDELGALAPPGLPQPDLAARGVEQRGAAATRAGIRRRCHHRGAQRHRPLDRGVGVIDRDVGVPARPCRQRAPPRARRHPGRRGSR